MFAVYADESGKTGKHLIVGSLWFLHPPEILAFIRQVRDWRESRGFQEEFHFKTISASSLFHYLAFAEFLAERSSVMSFKAISVERAGVTSVEQALQELYFHLLIRGVEHEHVTGRATLPRGIQLWKDLEEAGRDKLFLATLSERLKDVSSLRFNGELIVDEFAALDSKGQVLVQAADLYTSSINRVLNAEGSRASHKDVFADRLLSLLRLPQGPEATETLGDIAIHISL